MKVLSNLEFKNSTYILNKFEDFPENPVEGMTIFKENGLYIYSTNITSGNLEWLNILDFTRTNVSFKFEQGTESTEWNIAHNLNTQDLFVIVYDSDGNKQIESEIQFQSDNEIKLIFSEPISGKALLFGASVISSPSNMYTKEEIDELLKNIEVSGGGSNIILPEGGSDGYLLSKNGDELGWTNPADVGTKLPEDGLNGQVLMMSNDGLKWGSSTTAYKLNVGDLIYTFNDTPPSNTLLCDSSVVDKNSYSELYSVIGDKFPVTNDSKLMIPLYSTSEVGTVITDVTGNTSLGEESYYSAILNGNIKITTYGSNGGVWDTSYYGWYAFSNVNFSQSSYYSMWQMSQSGSVCYLEFEFLDGSKFAPYYYGVDYRFSGYDSKNWELLGYNEDTQNWDSLDKQDDISSIIVKEYTLYYFKVQNYDNTKCYNKFRIKVLNPRSQAFGRLYLYGTKEGEASIYDVFALPPSSTNESGAKACIVYTSGETQIQDSWTDISNLVPTNNTEYEFIAEYDGYMNVGRVSGTVNGGILTNNEYYAWVNTSSVSQSYIVPIFKGESYMLKRSGSAVWFKIRYWLPK